MTVADLVTFLQKQPQDLPVAFRICSEQAILEHQDIVVKHLSLPRPDGWVENARPDRPTQAYLVFPGN